MSSPPERRMVGGGYDLSALLYRVAASPVVATRSVMATTGALFYLTGAAVALMVALATHSHGASLAIEGMSAGGAGAAGVAVGRYGSRLPRWSFHVMNLIGTLLVSLLVATASSDAGADAMAVLLVYVPLDSYFFFSLRAATIYQVVGMAAVVILGTTHHITYAMAVTLLLVSAVAAVVVAWLVRAAATAETDPLTGLLNRDGFDRAVREAQHLAEQDGGLLSIGYLDIDRFDAVNRQYGAHHSDTILTTVAAALARTAPAGVTVARTAGDGYGFCFPGVDAVSAGAALERLREQQSGEITFSGGVADAVPGQSVSALITRARAALLEAKQAGRNRIVVSSADVNALNELDSAIDAGQLKVYYQPIVGLDDGCLLGAEALVRWSHPTRGLLGPDGFIQLAESGGLISKLGYWVLAAATNEAAGWDPELKVTVNASGRQLAEAGFPDEVLRILNRSGLAPDRLVIEVTESTLDADSGCAQTNLLALRAAGIRVALDDFGTGYSSLSRLDHLPIDIVKLDRSFVARITAENPGAPIVAAAVAMTRALGLTMVAEGIEDSLQAEVLAGYGCHQGQGYHFGRPAPSLRPPTPSSTSAVEKTAAPRR